MMAGRQPRMAGKRRALYLLPCFLIFVSCLALFRDRPVTVSSSEDYVHSRSRNLLSTNFSKPTCIPSGFDSFPGDFFTQEQRFRGGVLVHFLIVLYLCAMIAVLCDDYFVPSLEIISDKLKLPSDVAGATFMAIGTSAPELFSSITGSFVTEGDIGIGTIIGSAVFNLLAVTGLVGITLWDQELDIEWYPVARDCAVYGITVAFLVWILSDNIVTWWESLILLTVFVAYIMIMYLNARLEKAAKRFANESCSGCCCCEQGEDEEKTPLLKERIFAPELKESISIKERDSFSVEFTASRVQSVLGKTAITATIDEIVWDHEMVEATSRGLCTSPDGGPWSYVWWIVTRPAALLFFITIPDCNNEKFRQLFVLTFIMSVLWIGVLSYVAVWMVTVIGFTFSIPDSISGLTILAAGTSVPEIMASVIVAKAGLGNMAISNLVGSNTFDISFCLGAPWLVKTLISTQGVLSVYSSALAYTTGTLFLTLVAFVVVLCISKWKLNRTAGFVYIFVYIVFLVIACLYEFNVFGEMSLPPCGNVKL